MMIALRGKAFVDEVRVCERLIYTVKEETMHGYEEVILT